jgi:lysophospholipase L1-like esterase
LQVVRFQAAGPDAPHRFGIRTLDSGLVRILGVSVEKSAPGVVYSALGLVGARAEYLLKCREETFAAQIANEQPDLVIMGYGTNESSGLYLDENAYATALSSIIARIHRAAPSALVILLTPPDRSDNAPRQAQHIQTMLKQVMSVQRAVAWNEGAIVLDLHTAMGGAGSAEHWAAAQPPLAQPDMTHFTNEGYNLLGR